jgi:uncharacterized glyoxalase superfamily protein PhnB
MPTKGKPIPPHFHSVTPHLVIRDCARAIEFYKQAFGARELFRMPGPGGGLMHAEIQIGDSVLMLNDEFPQMACWSPQKLGGSSVTVHIYVENADEVFQRAVKAGATVTMPLADMFWGDRYGKLTDPFGHQWSIATHQWDMTPEEMQQAGAKAMAAMK